MERNRGDRFSPRVTFDYKIDPRHASLLLGADARGGFLGERAEHLTIAWLLPDGAAKACQPVLESIAKCFPGFAGDIVVLVGRPGSSSEQALQDAARRSELRIRFERCGPLASLGTMRNRALALSDANWVLLVEGDRCFVGDPLPVLEHAVAELGCHYLNLPIAGPERREMKMEVEGECLAVGAPGDGFRIEVRDCVAAFHPERASASLCTFLFGGAALVRRASLQALGGYDEAMFVGYEDIDLSIRLLRAGVKIGTLGIPVLAHQSSPGSSPGSSGADDRVVAERLRTSQQLLAAKHGLNPSSAQLHPWLQRRLQEHGIPAPSIGYPTSGEPDRVAKAQPRSRSSSRPRIGLVYDTEGWAFSNIARQVERRLSDRYEFQLIPIDVVENVDRVLMMTEECDLVHFFWRELLRQIAAREPQSYGTQLVGRYSRFERRFVRGRAFSTAVYDHLLLDPKEVAQRRKVFADLVCGYCVCSRRLDAIYRALPGYPAPTAVLEDGVDLARFKPARLDRFCDASRRELVVGWSGNSQWEAHREDFKGVHTILKPAIELLQSEGHRIRPFFADRAVRRVPHAEMPRYYSDIDVYVCASKIEGTPNPVLESMACGVPVISTDVGIVPQAFGPLQSQFILRERSVECLADALRRLLRDPPMFKALSAENLESIKSWDWSLKVRGFADFFDTCLARARQRRSGSGRSMTA